MGFYYLLKLLPSTKNASNISNVFLAMVYKMNSQVLLNHVEVGQGCKMKPVKYFLLTIPRRYFFVDHLYCLCLEFVMLSGLFIAALWSPARKGLTSCCCLWCLFVILSFWGSGVVPDCIDSWSLTSFLPDPRHRMGKWQKKSQEVSALTSSDHKAAWNRHDSMTNTNANKR